MKISDLKKARNKLYNQQRVNPFTQSYFDKKRKTLFFFHPDKNKDLPCFMFKNPAHDGTNILGFEATGKIHYQPVTSADFDYIKRLENVFEYEYENPTCQG